LTFPDKKSRFITKNDPLGQTLIRFHPAQQVLTKREPHQAGVFVPVAVCTGKTAVFSEEFSSLWAPGSSNLDWLSAQISWCCE